MSHPHEGHHHNHPAGDHHHHAHPPAAGGPPAGGGEPPNPGLFFKNMWGYISTSTLKAALELEVFTAVQDLGADATVAKVAEKIKCPERSTRMLLDYLAHEGYITKASGKFACTPSTSVFLVKSSPAYVGGAAEFLASAEVTEPFKDFAAVIRAGTTPLPPGGTTAPDHQVWVKFARGMAGMAMVTAQMLAGFPDVLPADTKAPLQVLDVAAGHGMYGIHVAKKFPNAKVTFQDWKAVLEVCKDHATKFGVAAQSDYLPGSAFEIDLKGPYDIILLTNILHHFDREANVKFVKRMVAALKPGGRIVTLEFVPNEERTAPPMAVTFPLMMLASTPAGDAYTQSQYQSIFAEAGAPKNKFIQNPTGSTFIVSTRE